MSNKVVPYFFGPTMHLSRLLGWTDAKVRFDQTDVAALLVDQEGDLRAASLLPAAFGVLPPNQTCEVLAHGIGTWRVPLDTRLPYGEGFLHLEYFQQRAGTMTVQIEDASGSCRPDHRRQGELSGDPRRATAQAAGRRRRWRWCSAARAPPPTSASAAS